MNFVGIGANIVLMIANLKFGRSVTMQLVCIGLFGISMLILNQARKNYAEAAKLNESKPFEPGE